jgi:hypothetical protein
MATTTNQLDKWRRFNPPPVRHALDSRPIGTRSLDSFIFGDRHFLTHTVVVFDCTWFRGFGMDIYRVLKEYRGTVFGELLRWF